MAPWYTTGVNKFLVDQKRLAPSIVFSHTDFNLDGSGEFLRCAEPRNPTRTGTNLHTHAHTFAGALSFILLLLKMNVAVYFDLQNACAVSKPEWYVLRHFWAPVAVSKNGPLQTSTNDFLKDGPLGGLFWDKNLIEV